MLPDQVSHPGPLTYESGALPIALRGPASWLSVSYIFIQFLDEGSLLPKQYQKSRSVLKDRSRFL